jgi:hypothetical protein
MWWEDLLLDLWVVEVWVVVEIVAAMAPSVVKRARQMTRAKGERFDMKNLTLPVTRTH